MTDSHLVIFDGVCHFCNGAVNFIIERDPEAKFVFTPMQSELAERMRQQYDVDAEIDTLLLIKNGECLMWSDAALEIARELNGLLRLFILFKMVPRPIRDYGYRVFARNRYRWFGRRSTCVVPGSDIKNRFVGV